MTTQTSTRRPIIGMRKLALHLGVHYNTVYNWKKMGFLKYKTAGKTMIFDPEDFLKSHVS